MSTMTRWSISLALILFLSPGVGMAQAQEDGTLIGWGDDSYGQISVPTGHFKAISAGAYHSLGIREDGTLAGWGNNSDGQINVPTGPFKAIAAGGLDLFFSLGIREDGTLAGWGNNHFGQINVPAGTFKAIAAGGYHGLALREDGTLVGWGYQGNDLNLISAVIPTGPFKAIAAGAFHGLALREDGTLAEWGNYGGGRDIDVPTGTFKAIAASVIHSLGIREDGTLAGWGNNYYGQATVPPGTFAAIAGGSIHSLALKEDGTLVGWGSNITGQLNLPTGPFTAITAGHYHSLGLRGSANSAPIAIASAPASPVAASDGCLAAVQLTGSGSNDPDGDALTFAWTFPGGTSVEADPIVTLGLGLHTITLTVSDGRGGTATTAVQVEVSLGFEGFLSPIGGADLTGGSFEHPIRAFKAGSTIPVKFKATCGGTAVLAGVHTLDVIPWSSATAPGDPLDATPTDAATTGDQFRQAGDQWHYNVDTRGLGLTTGVYELRATLSDGSQHRAFIRAK